ncbi:MAG: hypothetical protein ABI690_15235 [Chloroflexota bacterium]
MMAAAPDPNLMRLFGFTAADLEANQVGNMTPDQAERLREGNRSDNHRIGLFLVFSLLTTGLIFYAWVTSVDKNPALQQSACIFGILCMIGLSALVGYHWKKDRQAVLIDVENQQMGVASGLLILKVEYRNRQGFVRSAKVESKTLPLTLEQFNYLKGLSETGGGERKEKTGWRILDSIYTTTIRCNIYYANTSGTMMSMEILE